MNTKNNAFAYLEQGKELARQGRYEDAIKCFNKTIRLQPDNTAAYIRKASALTELGIYQKAMKYYDKAIMLKA